MNAASPAPLGEIAVNRSACTRRTSGPPLIVSVAAANGSRMWTQHSVLSGGRAPFGSFTRAPHWPRRS
jgi:hypothetical protein